MGHVLDGALVDEVNPLEVNPPPTFKLYLREAPIASGAALSSAVDLRVGPGTVTPVALLTDGKQIQSDYSLQASYDGETWYEAVDDLGAPIVVAQVDALVVARRPIPDFWTMLDVRFVRVRSGSQVTPIAQADDTTITLVCRAI